MSFLGRMKRRPSHDAATVRQTLQDAGATAEQAAEIVEILGRRLSPDEMDTWLNHPEKSHGVPDPEAGATFGVVLHWTPINAVSAGKTQLVIDEARRFARE